MFKDKIILVTGATGLIGSNLALNLLNESNCRVILLARNEKKIIDLFKEYLNDGKCKYVIQDITKPLEIDEKIDYIFHAAGPISGKLIKEQPVDVINPNILGTYNCLNFIKKQKDEKNINARLILFSSATVYKNNTNLDVTVKEEDTELSDALNNPICSYSQSKRMLETIGSAYKKQFEIDVVIARFSYVYGYTKFYPNTAIYQFINDALNDKDIVLNSDKYERRDYIYIDDAINGLKNIALYGESGEAYNISSCGKNNNFARLDELAEKISTTAKKYNHKALIHKCTYNIGNLPGIKLDNTKLTNLFSQNNIKYNCTSLQAGLDKVIANFINRISKYC